MRNIGRAARRLVLPLLVGAANVALAAPADAAHAAKAPLARGAGTLPAPAVGVSLRAAVRRCQRGTRVELRVGGRRLVARLPRRGGVLRRRWALRRGAGPVRWRYRLHGRRDGCPRRLARASLQFAISATAVSSPTTDPATPAEPQPQPHAAPAVPAGRVPRDVQLGTAVRWDALTRDADYRTTAASFSSWTPENEMKMEALAPGTDLLGRPRYAFTTADALVDRARQDGHAVHGHTLVFKNQIPGWVRNGRWTPSELRSYLRSYIETVVGRYRGRIASWDVVNEPLRASGDIDTDSFWYRHLGVDYIADAFRWAKAADPDAALYLNEVLDVSNPIAAGTYELVRQLRERGVPIDGVGFQTHVRATETVLTEEAFHQAYRRFADLGVRISVTEMDVDVSPSGDETLQAQVFRNAARACARVPACERFAVWGVTDRYSWLGADRAGLPIDRDYRPKPAWNAIRTALAAAPAT